MTQNALPRFIAASGLTNLADGVATVVWAWIASLLTRDPLLIALLPLALRLPWFLFAIPVGLITDRVDRKRLILWMDVLRMSAFVLAAWAVFQASPLPETPINGLGDVVLFWILFFCALLVGTAEVFRDNAAQTMLPALVPHDRLESANGKLWSVELVGNAMLGPALGAWLLATTLFLPFALNAAAFGAAALLVMGLQGSFKPTISASPDWKAELKEAFVFLRDNTLLWILAIATGVWNLMDQMVVIALVLHVQENLGLGAKTYGLILAASAFGGITAGLVAERVIKLLGRARTAQFMSLFSGFAFLAIPFAPNAYVLALILAAFQFSGLMWNTVSVSYRQRKIPDRLLGRVNSLYRLLAWGMMPIGLLLAGLVISTAEIVMPRAEALTMPFYLAALGVFVLTWRVWCPLQRGFDAE